MNDAQIIKLLVIWVSVIVMGVLVGYYLAGSPRTIIVAVVVCSVLALVAFRGMKTAGLTQLQAMYYVGFVGILIVVWSPFKAAAYITPVLFMGFFILLMSVGRNSLILVRTMMVLAGWVFICLVYKGINPDFVQQNALIALVTYGSFIPLLVVPNRMLASPLLLNRVMKIVIIVAAVEFSIGVVQAVVGQIIQPGALWDFVEGTMHIQPRPSGALDSVMYACNAACMILIMLAHNESKNRVPWPVFVLGLSALILGSVLHLIVILVPVVALAFFLYRPIQAVKDRRRMIVALGVFLLIAPILSATVYQSSVRAIPHIIEGTISNRNPKMQIVTRSLEGTRGRYPMSALIGLGPGQNGSRACLISAGYLGRLPPPLETKLTPPFAEFGLDQWIRYFSNPYASSTTRPASSWGAVVLEFGFLGLFLVAGWVLYMLCKLYAAVKSSGSRALAYSIGSCLLLLFVLGAVELYWELPQAIFAPLLVLKIMYANLLYPVAPTSNSDDEPAPSAKPESRRQVSRPIRNPVLSGGYGSMR